MLSHRRCEGSRCVFRLKLQTKIVTHGHRFWHTRRSAGGLPSDFRASGVLANGICVLRRVYGDSGLLCSSAGLLFFDCGPCPGRLEAVALQRRYLHD
jgi:hypothetical protein